jgi:glycosyltransferase involved in cell wall biosynthesis
MRCGVGDYTFQLALTLAKHPDIQVGVLTSNEAVAQVMPPEVDFFPTVATWGWDELMPIFRLVRDWEPDLVHIQYPTLGYGHRLLPWLLPLLLHSAKLRVVQTWHELYLLKHLLWSKKMLGFISKGIVPGGLVVVRDDYEARMQTLLRWALSNKLVHYIPNASAIPAVELDAHAREQLRRQYARPNAKIIVYFGFIYPRKRVELIFQIADPDDSHLIIIGDAFRHTDLRDTPVSKQAELAQYHHCLMKIANSERWKGKVTMCGFLPAYEAARVIAAADAVVLPIVGGDGGWSTSVHGAQAQGTFVLTTSAHRHGYDIDRNTYCAGEHDIDDMRQAIKRFAGVRPASKTPAADPWKSIGESHVGLYRSQLRSR